MQALTFSVNVPQWLALQALGRVYRRAFYSGPLATARPADIPEPDLPTPQWVKVKTLRCGFCASDLNLIMLRDSPTASPFTSFPCVMGHEVCGEIVEVGGDVPNAALGDRVAVSPALSCEPRGIDPPCPPCGRGMIAACENTARGDLPPGMFIGINARTGGGFGQYFVAHRSQLFHLPDGMPPETGALIEPFSVGLQAVMNNRPEPGESVLVIGGGVIGQMIVRTIRALDIDCRIVVAEPGAFAGDRARRAGADEVIKGGDLLAQTVRLTGAVQYRPLMGQGICMGGFHRIYDVVGNSKTLNTALRCLAGQGTLSQVGIGHDVKLDLTPLWLKTQTIKGVYGCSFAEFRGVRRHMFDIALTLAAEGPADITDMATHTFRLDEFEKMIEVNLNKAAHQAIKTMVAFD